MSQIVVNSRMPGQSEGKDFFSGAGAYAIVVPFQFKKVQYRLVICKTKFIEAAEMHLARVRETRTSNGHVTGYKGNNFYLDLKGEIRRDYLLDTDPYVYNTDNRKPEIGAQIMLAPSSAFVMPIYA